MTKYRRSVIAKSIFIITWLLFFMGCANIVPPTGGPKDELPPLLLDSISYPNKDHNTNRTGSNIFLVFNESTDIVGLKTELTSTPLIDNELIKFKSKSIRLQDTSGKSYHGTAVRIDLNQLLDSNTTYVLNFGRAFKDINEGKIAENISIAFSTGPLIDSLSVTGSARFNISGKLAKQVMVGLYTINDTSNASNTLPKYYTSTDQEGRFKIDYLKHDTYRLACFTDKNRNNKYDERTEHIAFHPENITLDSLFASGQLLLFKEDKRIPEINRIEQFDKLANINFNKGLQEVQIQDYKQEYIKMSINHKTLTLYRKLAKDTAVTLQLTDSASISTDTTISLRFDSLKIFPEKTTLNTDYQYINSKFNGILSFSQPIYKTALDSASVYATDTTYNYDSIIDFQWNKNRTQLIVSGQLPTYHDTLCIDNLSFISIIGDTITKSSTLIRTESGQFGSVYFKILASEPHYVIDLLDNKNKVLASGRDVEELSLVNYKPQTISIRILIDRNNNGTYDRGDYIKNILPEEYIYVEDKIKIKAGWDIDDIEILVDSTPKENLGKSEDSINGEER